MSSEYQPYQPKTLWITVLAWVCAGGSLLLMQASNAAWWAVLATIALVCLSFTVAVIKDLKDME